MPNRRVPMPEGARFERWSVLAPAEGEGDLRYWVRCDCGTVRKVKGINLRSGASRSCGCITRENVAKNLPTKEERRDLLAVVPKGTRFGAWTTLEDRTPGMVEVRCRCECGREKNVDFQNLRGGESTQCRQCGSGASHLMSKRPLYRVWYLMVQRCSDPMNARYGGRGISVCEEWLISCEAFVRWGESNGWQRGLQIDRIDNDGHYCPENCRFVTRTENGRNKSNNRLVTAWGETKPLSAWVADPRCTVKRSTVTRRIDTDGWEPERAIGTPRLIGGAQPRREAHHATIRAARKGQSFPTGLR